MNRDPLSTARLAEVCDALAAGLTADVPDAERIDRLRLLERVKAAAAAALVVEADAFARAREAAAAADGVLPGRRDRGIAAQVALAMRTSPWAAGRLVRTSRVLVRDLPGVVRELREGRTTQHRALTVAQQSIFLSPADRATLDRELAPRIEGLGDRTTEAETRRVAYRLDPVGYTDRMRAAEDERRVTLRPAPDTLCRLSALLPLAPGISAFTTLGRDADVLVAAGDGRTRGQVMADLLVGRLTGSETVAVAAPVEVELVVTGETLAGGDEPGELVGLGPLPAPLARDLASGRDAGRGAPRSVRRWLRHRDDGRLAAMESRARRFTDAQRRFLRVRDGVCRTPWCGAPIRHADHVVPVASGGRTAVENGQGLCQACNHARQAAGWSATVDAAGTVETTTPTGHRYASRQPDPPRSRASPVDPRAG